MNQFLSNTEYHSLISNTSNNLSELMVTLFKDNERKDLIFARILGAFVKGIAPHKKN